MQNLTRVLLGLGLAACGGSKPPQPQGQHSLLSIAADERMIAVPAGNYIAGSTPEERAAAYDDYQQTAGQDSARENKWFDTEEDRRVTELPAFRIDLMPVTQAQYAEMVIAGKAKPPAIDEATWKAQGFDQDFATEVARFVWKDGRPPHGREEHPVVLVTHAEAAAYCAWRGAQRGEKRRLPTAAEYEKASRGEGGLVSLGQRVQADKPQRGQGPRHDAAGSSMMGRPVRCARARGQRVCGPRRPRTTIRRS
jgi:formylglycine-generating enzyme required for sulfatase activity